jgi:hypothetical protein
LALKFPSEKSSKTCALALEIKPLWKRVPYLGVADLVFKALKSAFSAPRI